MSLAKINWSLTVLAVWTSVTVAVKFPNDIGDSPSIECSQESVRISVTTSGANASRIFAKGHFDDAKCNFQGSNSAGFVLSSCGMTRQRQLDPRGVSYGIVVVVQLHPMFITKVDRAYNLRCFYMESDKTVTQNLEVSMLRTDVVDSGVPMPKCTYSLHLDSSNGPLIKYTKVGDKVWHVWECASDTYGMLVHSCFVTDGQGNDFQIVDQNGCGVDQYVIRTPDYTNDLTKAQQETHVFKFADKMVVMFSCQIKLCIKDAEGCRGITPPNCNNLALTAAADSKFPIPPSFVPKRQEEADKTTQRSIDGHTPGTKDDRTRGALPVEDHNNTLPFFHTLPNGTEILHANETSELADNEFLLTNHSVPLDFLDVYNISIPPDSNLTINKPASVSYKSANATNETFVMSKKNTSLALLRGTDDDEGSGEESEGFLLVTKKTIDTPLRRNRSELNLRKQRRLPDQRLSSGLELETDLNQQMWVLEPEESTPKAETDQQHVLPSLEYPSGNFRLLNSSDEESDVCIPSWSFALFVSAFVGIFLILFFVVFCVCVSKMHKSKVSNFYQKKCSF